MILFLSSCVIEYMPLFKIDFKISSFFCIPILNSFSNSLGFNKIFKLKRLFSLIVYAEIIKECIVKSAFFCST